LRDATATEESNEVNVATKELKKRAAWSAVELVKPGMIVGLGHGSTAALAVRRIADSQSIRRTVASQRRDGKRIIRKNS